MRPLLIWAIVIPWVLWLGQWWVGHKMGWMAQLGSPRTAVIVGLSDLGLKLEKVLTSNRLLHTRVLGFFEDRSELPVAARLPVLGSLAALPGYIRAHNVQQVYITLPMTRDPQILALVDSLRNVEPVDTLSMPSAPSASRKRPKFACSTVRRASAICLAAATASRSRSNANSRPPLPNRRRISRL
jgi:hypothetical protein